MSLREALGNAICKLIFVILYGLVNLKKPIDIYKSIKYSKKLFGMRVIE
tara:strand:- start:1605 stop:1751 length:147 start_codon:yes stop_codon:yes gene_type:complete